MRWFLFGAAMYNAWLSDKFGHSTEHGAAHMTVGAIFFVGGTLIFAINDLRKRNP